MLLSNCLSTAWSFPRVMNRDEWKTDASQLHPRLTYSLMQSVRWFTPRLFATIWLTSLISPMTRTETTSSRRGASSRNGCGWDLDRVGAGRGMERSQNQPNHTNGQLPSPPHLQTPLRWSLNQASCVCLLNGIGLGELSGLVSINLKRRGDQWQRRHSIYVQNRG